jgi:hypothetical protein
MPIHCNNVTAMSIANETVKKQRSRAMEMRYFWVCDQVKHVNEKVHWYPSLKKLADYLSKHHDETHHIKVMFSYLHMRIHRARKFSRLPFQTPWWKTSHQGYVYLSTHEEFTKNSTTCPNITWAERVYWKAGRQLGAGKPPAHYSYGQPTCWCGIKLMGATNALYLWSAHIANRRHLRTMPRVNPHAGTVRTQS